MTTTVLLKPALDIRKHLSKSTNEDVKRDRLQKGRCPTCGYQVQKIKLSLKGMGYKRKPRNVPGRVKAGRCLLCDPDKETMRTISSCSRISSSVESKLLKKKNITSFDVARMRSINMDLQRLGGAYGEYGFGLVVQNPKNGNNKNSAENLTHVYPRPKSKKRMLLTLRPEKWEKKSGFVSARNLLLLVGNEMPRSERTIRPVTLSEMLKNMSSHAPLSGIHRDTNLESRAFDDEICVRFQTTFLPIAKKNENKTIEFAMESYNDCAGTSNLMLLCSPQGTSVMWDEVKSGKRQRLFHQVRSDKKGQSHLNKYWLEGQWMDNKGGTQQADPDQELKDAALGAKAIGTRFNVVMTVQIPIVEEQASGSEKSVSSLEEEIHDDDEGDETSSSSEESEDGWSTDDEDTYMDDEEEEDDLSICSEQGIQQSAAPESAPKRSSSQASTGPMAMNLHTMFKSGMIASTDETDDQAPAQTNASEAGEASSEDSSNKEDNKVPDSEEEVQPMESPPLDEEKSVLVFGVSPKTKRKKTSKVLQQKASNIPLLRQLSQRWKSSSDHQKSVDPMKQDLSSDVVDKKDPVDASDLLNFCPKKKDGKLKKGQVQLACISIGSRKGKRHGGDLKKDDSGVLLPKRHQSRINVTITLMHGVVGGIPNKEGVKAAVDEMEELYRRCGGTSEAE